jgi:hypothetical protein
MVQGKKMGHFGPQAVRQLVDLLYDVCRTLEAETGKPVSPEARDVLAKSILAAYDRGVTDTSMLKSDALNGIRNHQAT